MAERFDLSGAWGIDINYGESAGTCTFEQRGGTLRGTCGENPGTTVYPAEGELTGQHATWRVAFEENGDRVAIVFTGTVDDRGTTITGTMRVGAADPLPFQAAKISQDRA